MDLEQSDEYWSETFDGLDFLAADISGKEFEACTVKLHLKLTQGVNFGCNLTGYSFELDKLGTISAFIGGNYLKAELEVSGSVEVPGADLSIDYEIEQKNADRWNALVGANWDFSRRWSWSMEYNGFTGSRDAFITSVNYRF